MCSTLSSGMVVIFPFCPLVDSWRQPLYYVWSAYAFWRIDVVFLYFPEIFQVTSTASDPGLSFTIISCFISPNKDPAAVSDYTLIAMVCPKDDSVKFYPQRDASLPHPHVEKKSFAFTFNSKFNFSLLFLHCEMCLCSKTSQANSELPPVCSVTPVFSFIVLHILVSKPLRF